MKGKIARYFSFLFSLVFMFLSVCNSMQAYAAENTYDVTRHYNVNGKEVTINGLTSTDNADDIIKMAQKQIEDSDGDVTIMPASTAYGVGKSYLGSFKFYGENRGAYHTMNGKKMSYIVAYKQADNIEYSVDMYVACYQYGGKRMDYMNMNVLGGQYNSSDGYYYFTSKQFDIVSGVDYRFYYSCSTSGGSASDPVRTVYVKMWVILSN